VDDKHVKILTKYVALQGKILKGREPIKGKDSCTVLDNLGFVKDKTYWGRYFQGGVRCLNDADCKAILSKL